jgi:hypothetical protein
LHRELLSRGYNALLRLSFPIGVADAQCGCKVLRRDVVATLLSTVSDEAWFFDTELLARAREAGHGVVEFPITWIENSESSVHLVRTIVAFLQGIRRLRNERRRS